MSYVEGIRVISQSKPKWKPRSPPYLIQSLILFSKIYIKSHTFGENAIFEPSHRRRDLQGLQRSSLCCHSRPYLRFSLSLSVLITYTKMHAFLFSVMFIDALLVSALSDVDEFYSLCDPGLFLFRFFLFCSSLAFCLFTEKIE